MANTSRPLIDQLGGSTVLAAEISEQSGKAVRMHAVHMWKLNGIPWRWRQEVSKIADAKGIPLPDDFWSANSGQEIRKTRERRAG